MKLLGARRIRQLEDYANGFAGFGESCIARGEASGALEAFADIRSLIATFVRDHEPDAEADNDTTEDDGPESAA